MRKSKRLAWPSPPLLPHSRLFAMAAALTYVFFFRALRRSRYKFGRTLGAGTYGVVREAEGPSGKVAVKIILKKNVKNNEKMVYDELDMLRKLKHPHIVKFVDWFESRVSSECAVPFLRYRTSRLTKSVGQILHCHAAGHRWGALRPHLRPGKVYRKGRIADYQAGHDGCGLSAR